MHYYQFNIGDYRKDTAHLTPMEHYIYRTLIDWYYLDETIIPKETQVVMRRLSLDYAFEENLQNVLQDFFVLDEKGWNHKRIDMEIRDYHEQCVKNKLNGKLGGRPKKTQVVSERLANHNPKEPNRNPNQEPLTNNQEPIKTTSAAFALPDWVDKSHWDIWVKARKKMTPDQKQMQVAKLKSWKDAGLDYAGALANAAANGTQGLFLPSAPKLAIGQEIRVPVVHTDSLCEFGGCRKKANTRTSRGWRCVEHMSV